MKDKDIQLLKQRHEKTFNKFYDKYHKLFFSIIYKITKDFNDTEELTMDAFCQIMNKLNQYHGGNFKYWCITICKNMANMHLRKVIRERKAKEKYTELQSFTDTNEQVDLSDMLLSEIKHILNDEKYELVILHLVQKLKFREIAEIKKETVSSIIGKYNRAIQKVRKEIDHEKYR